MCRQPRGIKNVNKRKLDLKLWCDLFIYSSNSSRFKSNRFSLDHAQHSTQEIRKCLGSPDRRKRWLLLGDESRRLHHSAREGRLFRLTTGALDDPLRQVCHSLQSQKYPGYRLRRSHLRTWPGHNWEWRQAQTDPTTRSSLKTDHVHFRGF